MKTVMIADEDEIFSRALKKLIEEKDFRVVACVKNGEDMLRRGEELSPDIIFTEIRLPDGNGLDYAAQIKEQHPGTDFVVLSVYQELGFIKKAFSLRAKSYLDKPVSRKAIAEVLDCFVHDPLECGEIIQAIQEVVESNDYSRVYHELKGLSESILELSDHVNTRTAEILKIIKFRLFSRYIENPFKESSFMEKFPINTNFLDNEIVLEMWLGTVVDYLCKHRFMERYKSIEPVLRYIDEHIRDSISLNEVVENCHISHQYILRLFRHQMSMSALEYIQNRKIMLAKWYLYFEQSSTLTIAMKLGYEDGGYFAKVFKKLEGITPHQYKVRLRELYGR